MEEDEKTGRAIMGGVIAASAIIGGLIINEVVDLQSKEEIKDKISCVGKSCRMLWRVPAAQCDALLECDGCDKSITRLGGGECDGDANYIEPRPGHELARALHCLERDGLIAGWHAWLPSDVYINGQLVADPTCGVDIILKKSSIEGLSDIISSQSEIIYSAKESYAPEWAVKDGERGHVFAGEKVKKRVAK